MFGDWFLEYRNSTISKLIIDKRSDIIFFSGEIASFPEGKYLVVGHFTTMVSDKANTKVGYTFSLKISQRMSIKTLSYAPDTAMNAVSFQKSTAHPL
jgi:hypothetical protein